MLFRSGRSKGTTWRGKIIHPRMHHWVQTSGKGHRTPVHTVQDTQEGMPGPSDGPQVPPSKVWTTARSLDGEDPDMSKGPVLARVQALPCMLALPAQVETRCCRVACGP